MKNWKKIAMAAATLALSATLVFSATACTGDSESDLSDDDYSAFWEEYIQTSTALYFSELGDFYELYTDAKEAETTSERYGLMAIAEAKLMEAAVMVPTTADGGSYAISRVASNTVPTVLWGNDSYRYHQAVVTENFITSEDRTALKAMYNEMLGDDTKTGADYNAAVKTYLEEKNYKIKDTYSLAYNANVNIWDVLATSRATDSEVLVNTYDGLFEYDELGELQPALADRYVVSDDGLNYYFHIRTKDANNEGGAVWTDVNGSYYADVTADDFVAGFQHMMDAAGGLEYLVEGIIDGATEYISGTDTDFSNVGVAAGTYDEATKTWTAGSVDSTTGKQSGEWVCYTLESECSYFLTMLGYGVFAPMNRAYFRANGGAFGLSAFKDASSATSYTYAKSQSSILYCGPYRITGYTADTEIVFQANTSYWNYDNINIKKITWLYNDGSDATKAYTDAKAGTIDITTLNSTTVTTAQNDGNLAQYGYVTETGSTSYMAFYNLNRIATADSYDGRAATSMSSEDLARTDTAMQNVHFRRALSYAFDRTSYNAAAVGSALATTSLRNTYTPGNFVYITEAFEYDLDGDSVISEDEKFEAGTYYGEIMQAQITADDVDIKVWDSESQSSDGFDGWYSAENAISELKIAISELAAEGVEISASNPIQIDYIWYSASATWSQRGYAYQRSLESVLVDDNGDSLVKVNLIDATENEFYYSGYYTDYGYEANYTMYDLSGWGPDYGDPSTYLDTFLPYLEGYMTKCIGLF